MPLGPPALSAARWHKRPLRSRWGRCRPQAARAGRKRPWAGVPSCGSRWRSRAILLDQVLQTGKVFLQFVARAVRSDIDLVEAASGTDGRVSSMRHGNGNDGQARGSTAQGVDSSGKPGHFDGLQGGCRFLGCRRGASAAAAGRSFLPAWRPVASPLVLMQGFPAAAWHFGQGTAGGCFFMVLFSV